MPKSESSFKGLIKWLIICCTLRQALSYIIMIFDVFTDDFKIDQYMYIRDVNKSITIDFCKPTVDHEYVGFHSF